MVSAETTAVGWIGTGVMGASMCGHLLDAGLPGDRLQPDAGARRAAARRGAAWADSPAEVAAAADVVFTIVGYPADVREVFLGPSGAARRGARAAPCSST